MINLTELISAPDVPVSRDELALLVRQQAFKALIQALAQRASELDLKLVQGYVEMNGGIAALSDSETWLLRGERRGLHYLLTWVENEQKNIKDQENDNGRRTDYDRDYPGDGSNDADSEFGPRINN